MNSLFKEIGGEVDAELRKIFEARSDIPEKLLESMTYSTFAGGKRLRPMLVIAATESVGGDRKSAYRTAAAFELIHTYTLIHDDLPAMDDDELRRGVPTNHKKFGEATAILAGDGLLTLAFEVISEPQLNGQRLDPTTQVKLLNRIAKAVGAQGTVGGQEVDMECEDCNGDIKKLEYIHTRKTGAMITAALEAGGIIGGAGNEELELLNIYGQSVGHAFQIVDDILDVTGDTEKLGKPAGSDEGRKKMTYPSLLGLEKSKKLADEMVAKAVEAATKLNGNSKILVTIAKFIGERKH